MSQLRLDWKQDGDDYYADTPYGRATITELRSSPNDRWNINTIRYEAYIEQSDGNKISIPRALDDLEGAKWLLVERLQILAKEHKTDVELADLLSTLSFCRNLRSSDKAKHNE